MRDPIERVKLPPSWREGDTYGRPVRWREARARTHGSSCLVERAGHRRRSNLPDGDPISCVHGGGTAEDNNDARAKSWPVIVAFLSSHLAGR